MMKNRLKLRSHNIKEIIKGDFNHIRTNVIAWVIIVGLTVMPSLYAWFNIQASWDPYGNTGNLKIAIASDDSGYDGNLSPVELNMGDTLVSSIGKNKTFKWVVTDSEDAIDGVKSGRFYAAIVVPEDFSRDLMSIFSSKIENAEIMYYSNEKENAIATKVTDSGANSIEEKIDSTITKRVVEILMNTIQNLTDEGDADELALGAVSGVIGGLSGVRQQIQTAEASASALSGSIDSAIFLLDSAGGTGDSAADTNEALKEILGNIDKVDVTGLVDQAPAGLKEDLIQLDSNLKALNSSAGAVINDLDSAGKDLSTAANLTKKDLAALSSNLKSTSAALANSDKTLGNLITKLQAAMNNEDLDTVRTILSEDSDELSSFLSSPVSLETTAVYPVDNYGSAMAPFYTSLAIWVGGTILVAMLFTELSEERRNKLHNLTYTDEYIGRYALFFIIGILQAIIVCSGDLWFLGIQCEHPFKFMLAGMISSLVFVNLAYTLSASFGDIGKAICVIILVIQVAGSGGTFPIEMEPPIFRALYPILPFAHSMPAMREAIAGCYGMEYWKQLGILLIYLVFSLILGLVLRRPVIKLNISLKEKLEDTKVI